jgi:superfamily II DNA or RNA helicase
MALLTYLAGTIEIRGLPDGHRLLAGALWDARTACHRAPAVLYADVVRALVGQGVVYEDRARGYAELDRSVCARREPRPYQNEALEAWKKARGRGIVVLPTGAGKTQVALMAIADKQRSTLVVAPTLDLVGQWYDQLRLSFGEPVGVVGGGQHDVQAITVITYDSAHLSMDHLGAKFGLVVFDECHHLPSGSYSWAARACLAPFRLGLSATPERTDGRDADLDLLIGPVVYRKDIVELAGDYLAEYETEQIGIELLPNEREEYERERGVYRAFVTRHGIRTGAPGGWDDFIRMASRSGEGRRALTAYRRQRELAFTAPAKLDCVERLLALHRRDRTILFTEDNRTAYTLSERFLIPVITHQTKIKERSHVLSGFAEGTYGAVATSKVLNEGVDVPDANVAIVLSGSGSVREHVQRLGRVLRKKEGKRAVLYELVTLGTGETYTSERRREHSAYR